MSSRCCGNSVSSRLKYSKVFILFALAVSTRMYSYLGVFLFCPCEISIHFFRRNKLTLFLAVCSREVIKGIIDVHDLHDYAVCFLRDGTFGGVLTDRIYEFGKRPSGMDPAACDFEILAFFCKLMVDLISIVNGRIRVPFYSLQVMP